MCRLKSFCCCNYVHTTTAAACSPSSKLLLTSLRFCEEKKEEKKEKKVKYIHTQIRYLLTLLGTWSWCWQLLLGRRKACAATPTHRPRAHRHPWWWTHLCRIRLRRTTTMATPTSATNRNTTPVCSPSSPSTLFLNACMLPHDHLPRRLELPISIYKR